MESQRMSIGSITQDRAINTMTPYVVQSERLRRQLRTNLSVANWAPKSHRATAPQSVRNWFAESNIESKNSSAVAKTQKSASWIIPPKAQSPLLLLNVMHFRIPPGLTPDN
jgi:hypothetical protein